ncbi:SRPBCC family protein [Microbacterium oryzae]|uniref:SRPBCC family protein n=1 Tax=Microbacterium oryzae TaxID=743009 RepID=UPI0025AF3491|nr:SRPBCC family protein [Microbacterium oryzae]MDN3311368.1 SRPBCC family protein [Microbacterium oryzae]
MTRTLMARIHVAAPIDEAYRQWAQVEAFPRFVDTVTAVRRIDDVRSRWTISVGGFVDDIYVDVVEQVAPDRLVWQSTDGVVHDGRVELASEGTGTRVTLRMAWDIEGVADGSEMADAHLQRALERFKSLLEAHALAAGDAVAEDRSLAS